jgi:hypothetical protein
VECDRRGAAADPTRCHRARVNVYPTWIIRGTRHEGLLSVDELARHSGFPGP